MEQEVWLLTCNTKFTFSDHELLKTKVTRHDDSQKFYSLIPETFDLIMIYFWTG